VRKWIPIMLLASGQFVMTLDSSVMNVSITQIVADLNTTVQGVQSAITLYTLVMAAFMLAGAKLGDILGRNRAFAIGLGIYGLGTLTTAVSPNLPVLLFGWSLIEGLGAVMVIPSIAALTAASYEGKDRALAYSLIGAMTAIAVAAGPLIGGFVTTNYSWRWVFAGEAVVVVILLLFRGKITKAPSADHIPKMDYVGAGLSAAGLGLIVFGILMSSTWGLIQPRAAMTIGGTEITPFGLSVVPFLILGGLAALGGLAHWEERRGRLGLDRLIDMSMLRIRRLRAGLLTIGGQQLVLMGTFFVLPVYLQIVVGLDAFETGKKLLPLSAAMLVAALLGQRIAGRRSPRTVAQMGLVAISAGAVVMLATLDANLNDRGFKTALVLMGIGAGLLASQLGNVIMSSVDPSRTSEAGGLQGTALNLGASIGTALIGAVLIVGLVNGFNSNLADNPAVSPAARQTISANTEEGIDIVTVDEAEKRATQAGAPPQEASAIADSYGDAELSALRQSLAAVAFIALLSLWFTRGLPTGPVEDPAAGAPPAAASS
jgi:MFS family permease